MWTTKTAPVELPNSYIFFWKSVCSPLKVTVQRDYGGRSSRKHARLKYLISDMVRRKKSKTRGPIGLLKINLRSPKRGQSVLDLQRSILNLPETKKNRMNISQRKEPTLNLQVSFVLILPISPHSMIKPVNCWNSQWPQFSKLFSWGAIFPWRFLSWSYRFCFYIPTIFKLSNFFEFSVGSNWVSMKLW